MKTNEEGLGENNTSKACRQNTTNTSKNEYSNRIVSIYFEGHSKNAN
jgi:hypothetical protein